MRIIIQNALMSITGRKSLLPGNSFSACDVEFLLPSRFIAQSSALITSLGGNERVIIRPSQRPQTCYLHEMINAAVVPLTVILWKLGIPPTLYFVVVIEKLYFTVKR